MRGASGDAEFPQEVVEEGGVAQAPEPLLPVEGGECDEEIGERDMLAAEQFGEVEGFAAGVIECGGVHGATALAKSGPRKTRERGRSARPAGPRRGPVLYPGDAGSTIPVPASRNESPSIRPSRRRTPSMKEIGWGGQPATHRSTGISGTPGIPFD